MHKAGRRGHCGVAYTLPVDDQEASEHDQNWYTAEAWPDPVVRRKIMGLPPGPDATPEERDAHYWGVHNTRIHRVAHTPRHICECRRREWT